MWFFSYAIVVEAARCIQKQKNWKDIEGVKSLVFSSSWVSKFLNRSNMSRRKITTEDKKIPAVDEVIRIMKKGQDMYTQFEHSSDTVANMDETAFCYATGPEYL